MSKPDCYGVIGCPVKHSVSPLIHQYFAHQTKQALTYRLIEAREDRFVSVVQQFLSSDGKGLNVTLPFKQQAYQLADQHSDYARKAAAVNTLVATKDGVIEGHNTDGIGLVADLQNNCQIDLAGARVLIIGAGGAARGIIQPLADGGVTQLTIANRTSARASALCDDLSAYANIEVSTLEGLADVAADAYDGIINATSASLNDEMVAIPERLRPAWAYDLVYAARPTPFVSWFTAKGDTHAFDGFGMLIEQAAESFYLWRGVRPDTKPALQELRKVVF